MTTTFRSFWSRRRFAATLSSLAVLVAKPFVAFARLCRDTVRADEGPFYPTVPIPPAVDLTRKTPNGPRASGQRLYLFGRVVDRECRPVAGAVVEIWQCDARGQYDHPRSGAGDRLDPGFRYFARTETAEDGRYRFLTILPSHYTAFGIERAPHIHMKVHYAGQGSLTTEVYFAGEDDDRLRVGDRVYQSRGSRKGELIVVIGPASALTDLGANLEAGALAAQFEVGF